MLQFGHGTRPWNSVDGRSAGVRVLLLQFGHGTRPWNSRDREELRKVFKCCFNSATARGRGIPAMGAAPEVTKIGRFNSATARGRGIPPDGQSRHPGVSVASIRPRHEAVEFPDHGCHWCWWSNCFNSATARGRGIPAMGAAPEVTKIGRFNSATARGRGIPPDGQSRHPGVSVASIRPRHEAVEFPDHGCHWCWWSNCFNSATARGRGIPNVPRDGLPGHGLCFNSATARGRGIPQFPSAEVARASWLQFGHGTRPWNSKTCQDLLPWASTLQFGHGTRPWNSRLAQGAEPAGEGASIRPRHEAVEFQCRVMPM